FRHLFWRVVGWWQKRPLLGSYALSGLMLFAVFAGGYAMGRGGLSSYEKLQVIFFVLGVSVFAIRPLAMFIQTLFDGWW
ncbi:MAG: hypothetical protein D6706_16110, partial [Chloroflexi bacterium]